MPKKDAPPPPEPEKKVVDTEPKERKLTFVKRYGIYGEEPGNFRYPSDAITLHDNSILVTDSWNNRIQVLNIQFDKQEVEILDSYTFPDNMEPTGVTQLSNGRIFITCHGFGSTFHGIQEFGWSGIDPSKPVVVVKKKQVENTKKGKKGAPKNAPVSPEPEPEIIPKSKLWPLKFFGNKIGSGDNEFAYPSCIAAHEQSGCLLVADSGNFRMVVLKPGEKVTEEMTWVKSWNHDTEQEEGFATPKGVTVDQDGYVYITDIATNRVLLYRYDSIHQDFIYMKALIGDNLHSNHNIENVTMNKPFSDHVLDIINPWSLRINAIYDPVAAAVAAAASAAAAGAGGSGGIVTPSLSSQSNNGIPTCNILTLTDKSQRIHSFMLQIKLKDGEKTPSVVPSEESAGGGGGGVEEDGGGDDDDDDDDENEESEEEKDNYLVRFFHLSSYGPEDGSTMSLDSPAACTILRKDVPVLESDQAESTPAAPTDAPKPLEKNEYVVVTDSHNHSIVVLAVNDAPLS